jgi:hypothetical protein
MEPARETQDRRQEGVWTKAQIATLAAERDRPLDEEEQALVNAYNEMQGRPKPKGKSWHPVGGWFSRKQRRAPRGEPTHKGIVVANEDGSTDVAKTQNDRALAFVSRRKMSATTPTTIKKWQRGQRVLEAPL